MATIKCTVTNSHGDFLYSVLQNHCSHASAAGAFQVIKKGSLIDKNVKSDSTTVRTFEGDVYLFEDVKG